RAVVAHRPDLLQEPDGRERVLGAAAAEVILERVELGGSGRVLAPRVVLAAEDLADGIAREPGEACDDADGVALTGQVADVHEAVHSDHGGRPRRGAGATASGKLPGSGWPRRPLMLGALSRRPPRVGQFRMIGSGSVSRDR